MHGRRMNFVLFWVADHFMPQGLNILGATEHANICKVQFEKASYIELNSSTAEGICSQNPKMICEFSTVY